MPRGVYARKPRAKKSAPRRRAVTRMPRAISRRVFNPAPVFTESFQLKDSSGNPRFLRSNAGFLLTMKMSDITQRVQYSGLYQKYKILKVKWLLLPQYSAGSSDANAVSYNNSQGQPWSADARVVYVVNDTPAQVTPASETIVLQDNGCRIRQVKGKLSIAHKPVPDLQAGNGVFETFKNTPFINFDNVSGVDPSHYGVAGWITQTVNGAHPSEQGYFVYCKCTFQLRDPR